MRGSAQRVPGRSVTAALRAAWQGLSSPVHPGQGGALLPCGTPAPERFASRTTDRRVRPFGIRAQRALPSGTSARKVGAIPLPPYPHMRRPSLPA